MGFVRIVLFTLILGLVLVSESKAHIMRYADSPASVETKDFTATGFLSDGAIEVEGGNIKIQCDVHPDDPPNSKAVFRIKSPDHHFTFLTPNNKGEATENLPLPGEDEFFLDCTKDLASGGNQPAELILRLSAEGQASLSRDDIPFQESLSFNIESASEGFLFDPDCPRNVDPSTELGFCGNLEMRMLVRKASEKQEEKHEREEARKSSREFGAALDEIFSDCPMFSNPRQVGATIKLRAIETPSEGFTIADFPEELSFTGKLTFDPSKLDDSSSDSAIISGLESMLSQVKIKPKFSKTIKRFVSLENNDPDAPLRGSKAFEFTPTSISLSNLADAENNKKTADFEATIPLKIASAKKAGLKPFLESKGRQARSDIRNLLGGGAVDASLLKTDEVVEATYTAELIDPNGNAVFDNTATIEGTVRFLIDTEE